MGARQWVGEHTCSHQSVEQWHLGNPEQGSVRRSTNRGIGEPLEPYPYPRDLLNWAHDDHNPADAVQNRVGADAGKRCGYHSLEYAITGSIWKHMQDL